MAGLAPQPHGHAAESEDSVVPMSGRIRDTSVVRRLRLMADYGCHPLWEAGDNIDPWSIGLPGDLAHALQAWGADYTATLKGSDPHASGFADEPAASAWLLRGAHLAARLREEGFAVDYFHDGERAPELVAPG